MEGRSLYTVSWPSWTNSEFRQGTRYNSRAMEKTCEGKINILQRSEKNFSHLTALMAVLTILWQWQTRNEVAGNWFPRHLASIFDTSLSTEDKLGRLLVVPGSEIVGANCFSSRFDNTFDISGDLPILSKPRCSRKRHKLGVIWTQNLNLFRDLVQKIIPKDPQTEKVSKRREQWPSFFGHVP